MIRRNGLQFSHSLGHFKLLNVDKWLILGCKIATNA